MRPSTPIIALLGRPNVGKSTLFNRVTRSRDALVADQPGVTRDRQFGHASVAEEPVIVVDTGGLGDPDDPFVQRLMEQSMLAARDADCIVLLVDAREGLIPADEEIAARLRRFDKPVLLAVNKAEGYSPDQVADFYSLGLGDPLPISASHGDNVQDLMELALQCIATQASSSQATAQQYPVAPPVAACGDGDPQIQPPEETPETIRVAVVGRPNVGKSTLINAIIGQERLLAYDQPGTTRDSIDVPFSYQARELVLIDTAGVRRRGRIERGIEYFSVVQTLRAMGRAHVAVVLIDISEGLTDQDLHLLQAAQEEGCALVLGFNKWDLVPGEERERCLQVVQRRLAFVDYAPQVTLTASRGRGLKPLLNAVLAGYDQASRGFSTNELTRLLTHFCERHPPPLRQGRRAKLRYAHQGGRNPPTVVIHGNQARSLPANYRRYLVNAYRDALALQGTPLRLVFRDSENPFKGRRNTLTARQAQKRERLKRHVKRRG